MHTHIRRATSGWLFKKYLLSVKVFVDADELAVIKHNRLDRMEAFVDPVRDAFDDAAAAAHAEAGKRGIIVTRARDTAAIVAAEARALIATTRSLTAFKITVADLLGRGVTIENRSLRQIADIEQVMVEFIDRLDAAVQAAARFDHRGEDVYAPGTQEPDAGVPPAEWARTWRR
jgi:hypothetical protein